MRPHQRFIARSARRFAAIVTTLAATFVAPATLAAQAQATTGVIRGRVVDEAGAPLVGVAVTLRQTETNISRVVRTTAGGVYVGTLLPLGPYEASVRAIGFEPVGQRDIMVRVGLVVEVPFVLKRAATALAAVVVSDRAGTPVDANMTESAATLTRAMVEGIPNNGRNFLTLALVTPHVAVAQGPDGDVLSVAGQRGIFNNVSVDGADFNNPFFGEQRGGQRPAFTFNLDAVQELVVTSSGANAEFGRSAGGFVNVITKSGTNTFSGSIHAFGKNDALSGNLSGNGATLVPDFGQFQLGFTYGGPIIKDKLFFFTAFDQQTFTGTKQKTRPASAEYTALTNYLQTAFGGALANDFGAIERSNDATVFLAKVDWRVSDRSLFSAKYNYTSNQQTNGTFDVDTWGRSANAIEKGSSNALSGQLTTQLSNTVANEFRFQVAREDRPRDYDAPTLPSGRDFPDIAMDFGNAFRIGRPFFIPVEYYDTRLQLLDNISIAKGNHIYKAGVEVNLVNATQTFIGFANGRFIFSSVNGFINYATNGNNYVECSGGGSSLTGTCPGAETITGPVLLYLQQAGVGGRTVEESGTQSIKQTDMALYVQDTWEATPNLTINYGLRWEGVKQPDPITAPEDVFFSEFIGQTVGGNRFPSNGKIPSDMGMFQPRFGLAWDRKGNGTEVLRMSAGIYHARVASLNFAAVRNNNGSVGQTMFRNSALTGVLGAPPNIDQLLPAPAPAAVPFQPGIFVVDENFRNPRTMSATLGYERTLGQTGLVGSVSFTMANADRLTRFIDRNAAVFGSPWSTGLTNGGVGVGTLTTVESSASSQYRGLTIGLADRVGANHQWELNYTLSSDKSDDDNERDPFTFRYASADQLDREWGYSDRDQRHRLNAFVLSRLPRGFLMNNRFSYASAQPVSESCVANAPSGQRVGNDDRICDNGTILERNTLRRDNEYASWDLRIARPFDMGRGRRIEAIVEVFNVLGRNNFKDPAVGSLLFNFDGTIRSGFGDPRQIQAGMKYGF